MHLAVEVVCQSSVVVQARKVRAADVAHLKLLVTRGTPCVGKRAELLFPLGFGGLVLAHAHVFI